MLRAALMFAPLVLVLNETSTSLTRRLIQELRGAGGQTSGILASLNTGPRKPCIALNGIEKTRFTMSAVVWNIDSFTVKRSKRVYCHDRNWSDEVIKISMVLGYGRE